MPVLPVTDIQPRIRTQQITIQAGQSLSNYVDLLGCSVVAIFMPSAWTAAALTFQHSPFDPADNGNYTQFNEVWKDSGANSGAVYEISSAAATAGQTILVSPLDFEGLRFLKIRSGTVGAAVNQAANAVITLICKPVS